MMQALAIAFSHLKIGIDATKKQMGMPMVLHNLQ
jgi:hypothetical protein